MPDVEIKRGYEVLPDNNVRFGIRVINSSDFIISDVEVILDYNPSLFELTGNKIQNLSTVPPAVPRTAKFILKPLGCIHNENIGATIIFKDHQWKKHTLEMRPKEVHCVCPFLKEKSMNRAEFLRLSNTGYLEERGVNFEGIDVDKLVDFLAHTCKNRLYKVDEFPIESGKIIYLAGDALGEKAYYLLTAVVKEYEGLAQVLLRACSDKSYGLSGFLNEILDNLRHLVQSTSAREIGVIKKEQVINIIDSVVQRTTFATGEGAASVKIKDSVVKRADFKVDEEKKRREEERLREEQEEMLEQDMIQKSADELESLRRRREELKQDREKLEKKQLDEKRETKRRREIEEEREKLRLQIIEEETQLRKLQEEERRKKEEIGMEFVQIPAGEFDMGSPSNEAGRYNDEGPVHCVKIADAFYMGKYEVTQKQWRDVMGTNHSYFEGDNLPVEKVSWNDVQEFIKKLNGKEGTNKYRLPSEAEWEYAARAGTTTRYSFGDDESKLGEYAWYEANSGGKTHEVGQKKPNPWGLYDMHGNVWEWVQDNWHSNYDGAPTDGSAWEGGDYFRVIRGGCWYYVAGRCRSAARNDFGADDRCDSLGFRLLREM